MALKIGDTVRYLNAVGGGRVVKIVGDLAYVDEDGFETPVLARECVVVAPAATAMPKAAPKTSPAAKAAPVKETAAPAPTKLPVIETSTGEKINLVLGFEATDLKALSQSSYEAYLVNDSNFYIFISIAAKATAYKEWKPLYDGVIEPNIQEFLFDFEAAELVDFDRVLVQHIAFKRGKDFSAKAPGSVELKVDTTKFAKLHCFRPNPYFDNPVIAFDIVTNDHAPVALALDPEKLSKGMKEKARDVRSNTPKKHEAKPQADGVIEVDLHADELFDNLAGMGPADILNSQIDKFQQVMNENLKRPGTRIVFIHGKGEGVLRQAIMKELNHRYKGHDVQDASFREYGFGATQVTIRKIEAQQPKPSGKKKHK